MTTSPGPMRNGADGASTQRTRLAWRRTVLATTAIVLLILRLAIHDGLTPLRAIAAAAALGTWIAQLWLTQRRIDEMARPRPAEIGRTLPAMGLIVIGYAILGIVLIVISTKLSV